MICRGCKTIFDDADEKYTSCDYCFKVWCETCSEFEEMSECPGCDFKICSSCLVAEVDTEKEVHTGRLICPNCCEVIDVDQYLQDTQV